jgi:hypothetical protein
VPSIPPTPDAYYVASEEEDDNSCQMLGGEENGRSIDLDIVSLPIDRGPLEPDGVEDVFLCAECDIVFASKELCCRHMHEIHGLMQFNAAFIQEAIISKKPGSEGVCAEDSSMDVNDDSCAPKAPVEGRRKKVCDMKIKSGFQLLSKCNFVLDQSPQISYNGRRSPRTKKVSCIQKYFLFLFQMFDKI